MTKTISVPLPGTIREDEVYTRQELMERMKLGASAMRQARRQSLVVRRIGRQSCIDGGEFVQWFRTQTRTI
jgi:hypothetical protein